MEGQLHSHNPIAHQKDYTTVRENQSDPAPTNIDNTYFYKIQAISQNNIGDVVKYRRGCVLDKAISTIRFLEVERKLNHVLVMDTGFTEGAKNYDNSRKPPQS